MMQGGDKTPLLTFDVGKLAGNDADREKRLRQLLNEDAAKDKVKEQAKDQGKGQTQDAPADDQAKAAAPAGSAPAQP
jgi:hypothetical protein